MYTINAGPVYIFFSFNYTHSWQTLVRTPDIGDKQSKSIIGVWCILCVPPSPVFQVRVATIVHQLPQV